VKLKAITRPTGPGRFSGRDSVAKVYHWVPQIAVTRYNWKGCGCIQRINDPSIPFRWC